MGNFERAATSWRASVYPFPKRQYLGWSLSFYVTKRMHHSIHREDVGQHSMSLAALLLLSSAGTVHAQVSATPPPEVRQQGEQQERLQREREEAQRGLLKNQWDEECL